MIQAEEPPNLRLRGIQSDMNVLTSTSMIEVGVVTNLHLDGEAQ